MKPNPEKTFPLTALFLLLQLRPWVGVLQLGTSLMPTNYLKIFLTQISATKLLTLINVTGLDGRLASCMLITLFVGHELDMTPFFRNADDIHRFRSRLRYPTVQFRRVRYRVLSDLCWKKFRRRCAQQRAGRNGQCGCKLASSCSGKKTSTCRQEFLHSLRCDCCREMRRGLKVTQCVILTNPRHGSISAVSIRLAALC